VKWLCSPCRLPQRNNLRPGEMGLRHCFGLNHERPLETPRNHNDVLKQTHNMRTNKDQQCTCQRTSTRIDPSDSGGTPRGLDQVGDAMGRCADARAQLPVDIMCRFDCRVQSEHEAYLQNKVKS
jgi:hypothetical protein